MGRPKQVSCDELEFLFDTKRNFSIRELIVALETVIMKYGARSTIEIDSGYNNICVEITPSKVVKC